MKPGKRLITALCISTIMGGAALQADPIHQWAFGEAAGTLITAAANSGTVGGVQFSGGDPGWTTNGSGSLEKRFSSGNTLIQSVANLGTGINFGDQGKVVSFAWDVSWSLPDTAGFGREWFMINRNVGGANQFRFALENFANNGNLLLRTTASGFANGNNAQHLLLDLSQNPTGNFVLQVSFAFNATNTQVIGVEAAYSLNGGAVVPMVLGDSFTPYNLTDIGELRSHAKGNYINDNYYSLNSLTVTVVPEPSTYAALIGLAALALVMVRRRRR